MADVGHNGGPPLKERNFKRRWAMAVFCHPKKPAGAVAMAFKLYMEMDTQGEGAIVSDLEFSACCGVSDRSVREFKTWLVRNGFVRVRVKGARGRASAFAAQIPNDAIPAMVAGIQAGQVPATSAGKDDECRKPSPEVATGMPEVGAGNRVQDAPAGTPARVGITSHGNKESPSEIITSEELARRLASSLRPEPSDEPEEHAGELAGLNGSAELMVDDILRWLEPPATKVNARQWLASTLRTFGQDVTAQSYHKLKTDLMTGGLVAKPLQAWSKIAQRMKAEPKAAAPPKDTAADKRERMRKSAEAAEAKYKSQQQWGNRR